MRTNLTTTTPARRRTADELLHLADHDERSAARVLRLIATGLTPKRALDAVREVNLSNALDKLEGAIEGLC